VESAVSLNFSDQGRSRAALAPVCHEPVADARPRDDAARRLRVRLDPLAQVSAIESDWPCSSPAAL